MHRDTYLNAHSFTFWFDIELENNENVRTSMNYYTIGVYEKVFIPSCVLEGSPDVNFFGTFMY